jgi:branched-chain amino acid transport system permease protein
MIHDHLWMLAKLDYSILPEELLNGVLQGAIYALIALGYTMVYGVLKLINFAHGDVYMLGAYLALFGSYFLGFTPDTTNPQLVIPAVLHVVSTVSLAMLVVGLLAAAASKIARGSRWSSLGFSLGLASAFMGAAGTLVCQLQPQAVDMFLMILFAMVGCALVGVVIERFAYRPMRSHSRIATLITAIGVSLLLEYGGQLFLPNSPPPSVAETVNPYRAPLVLNLVSGNAKLVADANASKTPFDNAQTAFDQYLASHPNESRFQTGPEGTKLKDNAQALKEQYDELKDKADNSGVKIHYISGQVMILTMTVVLMVLMTYLVLYTKAGRAMRAVSHDFDSASLMGVNVNSIVVFTFVLGSSLAGAGAMMQATVQSTPLTTFSGLIPGVKAFVAAVLGGIGNIPGAVVGGLLMGIAETVAAWAGYSEYRDAIAFVILILVLLFRPSGILGSSQVEKV